MALEIDDPKDIHEELQAIRDTVEVPPREKWLAKGILHLWEYIGIGP